jgi:hypothetical protein
LHDDEDYARFLVVNDLCDRRLAVFDVVIVSGAKMCHQGRN